jgi:hypothetical protein
MEVPLPLWKKLLYGLISTIIVLLVLLIFAEAALRVVVVFMPRFRSAPFRQYDPVIGEALIPNKSVVHSRGCFQGHVVTNQWGERDRERTLEKPAGTLRIALIGDSVVEAAQVRPDEVLNIQMEKLLAESGRKNVEVMAFGVEGIGTTQELLVYQEKVRQFRPDIVLLLFVDNDIMNNSSTIQPRSYGVHTWYAPYYNLAPDGRLVLQPVQPKFLGAFGTFLENHSLAIYYLEHIWERADIGSGKWEGIPLIWGTYGDPPDEEWSQAWLITEKVLKRMKDTVEADGAKFVVIKAPSFSDVQPDFRERLEKEVGKLPPNFNAFVMQPRLQAIADRQQIAIDFMAPEMKAYGESHNLKFPYFSFTCDSHWSAMGHGVAAEVILRELDARHLLPPAATPAVPQTPPTP